METTILNLIPDKTSPVTHVSQYDAGRVKRFMLYDGALPYTLTGEETVELHIRKPNGEQNTFEVENTGESYLDLTLTEEMTDMAGRIYCKFHIDDLATKSFWMEVEPGPARIYTGYADGEIVEFETDLVENLIILNVELSPSQDFNGYDSQWIGGAGKNLFDIDSFRDTDNWNFSYPSSGQMPATSSNPVFTIGKLSAGQTYTLHCEYKDPDFPTYLYFGYYNSTGTTTRLAYMTTNSVANRTFTFTAIYDVYYCFRIAKTANFDRNISYVDYIQLEKGSTATDWVPYQNICPIEGTTVIKASCTNQLELGSEIEVSLSKELCNAKAKLTTGKADITSRKVKISDLSWSYNSQYKFFNAIVNDIKKNADASKKLEGLSHEGYVNRTAQQAGSGNVNGSIAGLNNNIQIKDLRFEDVTSFVNAVGDYYILYPLESSYEDTVSTPASLPTLVGTNIVYSDAGPVEVAYHKMTQEGG